MTRHRKSQLSMQCWYCLSVPLLDPALSAQSTVADIRAHFDHVAREYRVLARWRKPFRV